jgi:hypothetical protein
VFLRWGILGILSVAALLYAYNASKRLAESHERRPAPDLAAPAPEEENEVEPATEPEAEEALSPHCEVEWLVARRAIEGRRQSEPLDRVLRMQQIAWQEPAERRERLEQVATRWYEHAAPISAEALRNAVVSDCESPAPAP